MKDEERFAGLFFVHVDITPPHRFSDPGPECFRDRFLRREASREMARWKFHRDAICDFAFGKDAFHETIAESIERMLDALYLDYVYANTKDAHRKFWVAVPRLALTSSAERSITSPHRCNSPSAEHLAHGVFATDEDCARDNGVPDVELSEMRNFVNQRDVSVVDSMAGIHLKF